MRNKIAIIDPVGAHGGMHYTTYGYCSGFMANNWHPFLFTCEDKASKDSNAETFFSFKDIWKKQYGWLKFLMLLKGYVNSFLISNQNQIHVVNLHFFKWGGINTLVLIMAKIFFKGKVIVTIHDVKSFKISSNLSPSISIQICDGFIFFNEFSKDEFSDLYGLKRPYTIASHGNYLHFFSKLEPRARVNRDKIRLLFFGQLKAVKGIDILLDAFKIVCQRSADFELTIVGRPWKIGRDEVLQKIHSTGAGDRVKYHLNYVSDVEANEYYKNTDVVVLPYTRIYNSAVMLLSFSYGRPVITSDLPPFLDRVENGYNGLTFKSKDPMDLANTILSTRDYNLAEMGNRGHEKVKVLNDWQVECGKIIDFIVQL